MQYLSEVSKMTEWSLLISKANHSVSQVCAPTINAKEAEVEQFYEDPVRLSRTNTKKRCPFPHMVLECKSRKSRDTWSNRQVWPWGTKWSRTKANSFAKRTHWSQQTLSSNNTKDDSTYGYHQMVSTKIRLIIFFAAEDKEALYSQQKQDLELAVAQFFRSLLKNSGSNRRK